MSGLLGLKMLVVAAGISHGFGLVISCFASHLLHFEAS